MALVVVSQRSRIVLTLPTPRLPGVGADRADEALATRAGAAAEDAAADGVKGVSEILEDAADEGGGVKEAAARARRGAGGGLGRGANRLFGWITRTLSRLASRAFLVVAGLQAAGEVLRRVNETAQRDDGWRRMTVAADRLGLALVKGALSSQVVRRSLESVAEDLGGVAGRWAAGDTPLAWAAGLWDDAARALQPFTEIAHDIGMSIVGRLELALSDLLEDVQGAVETRLRARAEAARYEDGPGGVVALTLPGSGGAVYDAPQNRVHRSGGTATFLGYSEAFERLASTLRIDRAAVQEAVAAAEARLEARARGWIADLVQPPPGRGGGAGGPADGATTPAGAAAVATRTGLQGLVDEIQAWSTGGPGSTLFQGLQTMTASVDRRLSETFAQVRGSLSAVRAQIATTHRDLLPAMQATEGLAEAFGALSAQVEAITQGDARATRAQARAQMIVLAAVAATQAAIETAAGVAAALSLRVHEAVLHFAAAAAFVAAAILAGGRSVGGFGGVGARSPEDARQMAQQRLDTILASVRGGSAGRLGSVVLVVHGDADFESDEKWLRRNILEPIASAGQVRPTDEGTDGLRALRNLRASPGTAEAIKQTLLRASMLGGREGSYGGAIGGALGFLIGGPVGYSIGVNVGYWIDGEIRRVRERAARELRRIARRIRKIF